MTKRVVWSDGKVQAARPAGTYSSYAEYLTKAERFREEQASAQAYLAKAELPMLKLLELRFTKGEPLIVMRPLRYQTSEIEGSNHDELDKSFYNTHKSSNDKMSKFIDVVKTIYPGTQLMLKGLDTQMREFIFTDGGGKEHAISFDERRALLTQTDIFETVREYFEKQGK